MYVRGHDTDPDGRAFAKVGKDGRRLHHLVKVRLCTPTPIQNLYGANGSKKDPALPTRRRGSISSRRAAHGPPSTLRPVCCAIPTT